MLTEKPKKTPKKYVCEYCDYISLNKRDFYRHNDTIKHNANKMLTYANAKNPLLCSCGKSYKHRSSLARHKKQCITAMESEENNRTQIGEYSGVNKVELLEKQVETMTILIKELIKTGGTHNTIVGDNNNMNFNKHEIKIYLSQNCANALSIQEFAKQLSITLDDLNAAKENTVLGISHIVEKNLKPLSFTERPVHCLKENEWYVNDYDEGWNEDDGEKIINEAHKRIQKQCLIPCLSENTDDNCENVLNDNVLSLISFGTSDLKENEKLEIKRKLSSLCVLRQ